MPDRPIYAVTANSWRKTPASKSRGPYASDRDQWVGYDDPSSAAAKAEYIAESGFGGAALWTADLDDFNNLCCLGPNPVTRAVSSVLRGVHASPPVAGCGRPPPVVTPEPFVPTTTTFDWGSAWTTTTTERTRPKPPKQEPEDINLVERPPPQYPDADEAGKEVRNCLSSIKVLLRYLMTTAFILDLVSEGGRFSTSQI